MGLPYVLLLLIEIVNELVITTMNWSVLETSHAQCGLLDPYRWNTMGSNPGGNVH